MWIKRDLLSVLRRTTAERPAVVVTGSRQVGKSSLLEHSFPDHRRIALDLPALADEAESSGEQFLERYPPPVIIDEIQYAPRLLRHIKAAIDARRAESGLFLLTGSQKFALMEGIAESLAGRVGIVEMHSLSLHEIETAQGRPLDRARVLDAIVTGGYPEIHARALEPQRFYADYVATYLERDVRQALAVRNLRDFDRFLRLCALRSGQILSHTSLAGDVGLAPNTIRSWMSVLEASGIVMLLPPYYRNLGKRLVKTPKLYFMDTGLCCFLAGIDSPETLAKSALLGPLWETLVLGQLVRTLARAGRRPDVYFYRDYYGAEVDFVIPVGEKLRLYECKWAESPPLRPRGFAELERLLGQDGVVSRSILVPERGHREVDGTIIEDCVEIHSLAKS